MPADDEVISVYRLLKYTGPKSWIDRTLQQGAIPPKGIYELGPDKTIRSVILDFSNSDAALQAAIELTQEDQDVRTKN